MWSKEGKSVIKVWNDMSLFQLHVLKQDYKIVQQSTIIQKKSHPCWSYFNVLEKFFQEVSDGIPGVDAVGTVQHYDNVHFLLAL